MGTLTRVPRSSRMASVPPREARHDMCFKKVPCHENGRCPPPAVRGGAQAVPGGTGGGL